MRALRRIYPDVITATRRRPARDAVPDARPDRMPSALGCFAIDPRDYGTDGCGIRSAAA
jgi:hypothetical protein